MMCVLKHSVCRNNGVRNLAQLFILILAAALQAAESLFLREIQPAHQDTFGTLDQFARLEGIAEIVHLSEQTVHNYRASGMEKLGFHDRVELLKYALRRGVISVADL